jgi:hypothetical protein
MGNDLNGGTVELTVPPLFGTVNLNANGSFTYIAPSFAATVTFEYTVYGLTGGMDTAVVTIQVTDGGSE